MDSTPLLGVLLAALLLIGLAVAAWFGWAEVRERRREKVVEQEKRRQWEASGTGALSTHSPRRPRSRRRH